MYPWNCDSHSIHKIDALVFINETTVYPNMNTFDIWQPKFQHPPTFNVSQFQKGGRGVLNQLLWLQSPKTDLIWIKKNQTSPEIVRQCEFHVLLKIMYWISRYYNTFIIILLHLQWEKKMEIRGKKNRFVLSFTTGVSKDIFI